MQSDDFWRRLRRFALIAGGRRDRGTGRRRVLRGRQQTGGFGVLRYITHAVGIAERPVGPILKVMRDDLVHHYSWSPDDNPTAGWFAAVTVRCIYSEPGSHLAILLNLSPNREGIQKRWAGEGEGEEEGDHVQRTGHRQEEPSRRHYY